MCEKPVVMDDSDGLATNKHIKIQLFRPKVLCDCRCKLSSTSKPILLKGRVVRERVGQRIVERRIY